MIKIFNTQQIREWDTFTIKNEPIASIDLMERASGSFVQWFTERFNTTNKIGVICGVGNNGGDGLAIARLLKEWNYPVKVWIVRGAVKETDDFKLNLTRLEEKILTEGITSQIDSELFNDRTILIDAVFGSGLSRPAEGIYAQVIQAINKAKAVRVAVDIPSGLSADQPSSGEIVKADHTVTFQAPKLSFLFPQSVAYTGEWHVVDIGLSKVFQKETETPYLYLTRRAVKKLLKPRLKFSNKGDHGKALLIAGSYGKMGACVLSARSTLRAGAGLLTVHIPKSGYTIIQTAVPEAMASVDTNEQIFSSVSELDKYDVIGIGPGLGKEKETVAAFQKVLAAGKPMIIDADALNILSEHRELLHLIPSGSILTPHPKEFERLVGKWNNDFERLNKQIQLSNQLKAVIVLKGANTSIATPEGKVYFNSTGNAGMATGGTGDVLTGILTGLLAQKYSAEDAAILGVYLHGL
ncbi:MAG TPA: NAD(P)H-hydrate dehydratase, partial [Cyclobacteriaceae bacterium]